MEALHPVAQVTALLVIGLVLCVVILSFTGFFDRE